MHTRNDGLVRLTNPGVRLSRKFELDWVRDLPIEKVATTDPVNPSMVYVYAGMYDCLHDLRAVPVSVRDNINMAVMLLVLFLPILFLIIFL